MKTLRVYITIVEEYPVEDSFELNREGVYIITSKSDLLNDLEVIGVDSALLLDSNTGKYKEIII